MTTLLEILLLFLVAAAELWAAVPLGFAFGFDPLTTGTVCAAGALAGTWIILHGGERLRQWFAARYAKKHEKKEGALQRVWDRHGIVGLGLLAPLVTGAPIGAALAIFFGADRRATLLWFSIGILLWTLMLTLAGLLGTSWLGTLGG